MDTSPELAFLIFRKWETDSSLITATLRFGGNGATCRGFVSFLDSELMVILSPDTGGSLHVDLTGAIGFDYKDSREMPPSARRAIGEIMEVTFDGGMVLMWIEPE